MRSALRYFGGKGRMAEQIIGLMPAHKIYVEPFAGGANVLIRKPAVECEVLNDLNSDVVTFFQLLRDDPQRLIRAIKLTPFSRSENIRAWQYQGDDPLEIARTFYVRCWQSWGSGTGFHQSGWRYQVSSDRAAIRDWNKTAHLLEVAQRLKTVQIECDDALKIIKRYDLPQTLFYLDPPYVHSTRMKDAARKGYKFEMTDGQHEELLTLIQSLKGMVILSGYRSALYDSVLGNWCRYDFKNRSIDSKPRLECVWTSPNCGDMAGLPMFAGLQAVGD